MTGQVIDSLWTIMRGLYLKADSWILPPVKICHLWQEPLPHQVAPTPGSAGRRPVAAAKAYGK